jgi:transcriptional regulator with XRE-family HTH domain
MNVKENAAPTLTDLRESRALTMREVGIDPSTLVQLEKGRRKPQAKTLKKLARVYRTTPAAVLDAWKISVRAAS